MLEKVSAIFLEQQVDKSIISEKRRKERKTEREKIKSIVFEYDVCTCKKYKSCYFTAATQNLNLNKEKEELADKLLTTCLHR